MTSSLRSLALARRPGTVTRGAPYLSPRRHRLFESSVRMRKTSFAVGLTRATLYSSSPLSKVIVSIPSLAAFLMNDAALQGLAKMIRDGLISRLRTWVISAMEAQSKPVPSAAKRRSTYGSGLHFTATARYVHISRVNDPESDGHAHRRMVLFRVGGISIFDIGCIHSSSPRQNKLSLRPVRQQLRGARHE